MAKQSSILSPAVATERERRELEGLGFTPEQIERLCSLRAVYPLIEIADSREEFMRLLFLKWLYVKWPQAADGASSKAGSTVTDPGETFTQK